jgi:outer membrane lipoprotein SlyB
MSKKIFIYSFMGFLVFALTGCQTPLTGSSYERGEARKMHSVYLGTVVGVNDVVIQGEPGAAGTITGAAAGAAAGHAIGRGDGRGTATVIGGVVGAVAGGAAEKKISTKQGIVVTVKLEDGRTVAIVQEKAPGENYQKGDNVQIVYSSDGTARVKHY